MTNKKLGRDAPNVTVVDVTKRLQAAIDLLNSHDWPDALDAAAYADQRGRKAKFWLRGVHWMTTANLIAVANYHATPYFRLRDKPLPDDGLDIPF